MKLLSSLVILIVIIAFCNGLTKYTKDKIQRTNANKVQKRVNTKPFQLKGKQLPLVQGKGKQAKLTKTANAKRWMPSQNAAKKSIKYTPKVVNNTKRWMPGFADLGQSDMESSMMFDSGIVSSDPPSAYPSNPQQPPVEYGIPQQDAASARQQTTPPEQSYLTPDNNGQEIPYQGQAAMGQPAMGQPNLGQPQGNQYQGFGNDIESYTKEISNGLDGENGANTEYSALDNYQDSSFMNSKFQEGDYIGSSLQEAKQPNLFDSFSLAPGMAENFVNPPKETGGGAGKGDDGKSKGKADKGGKEEDKNEEKGAKTKPEKGDSRDKDEDKADKEEKDSEKGKKQKSSEKAKQNVKDDENAKAITGNDKDEAADGKLAAKESNDVSDSEDKGKEVKETKGKTKEAKEKNVAKFDKGEKNEKEGGEKIKKLTKNKNKENEGEAGKASANQKAEANSVGQSEVAQRVAASLNNDDDNTGANKEEDGKEAFKVDSKGGKGERIEADKESKVKNGKGAAKFNKQVKNTSTHKNVQGNGNAKDDSDNENGQVENNKAVADEKDNNQNDNVSNEQEVKQAANQAAANSENDDKEEVDTSKNEVQQEVMNSKNAQQDQTVSSSNNDMKDDSRIRKLKQRINNQKLSRHHGKIQQDAAARYKITTDTENTVTDSALANNVSPVNGAIGLAAGELRKQLVTNLRHQLMKNVAAAIARGKGMNTAAEGATNHGSGEVQNVRPNSGQNGGAAASAQASMQRQGNNEPSSDQDNSKMTSQGSDSTSEQETASQQGSNSQGGSSQDDSESLVPTLMKMDKNMLVDTILKLLKKNKEGKMKEESKGESKGQKQMTGDNTEGDKESQDGGTLNQSFHSQESGVASDEENGNSALVSQGHNADAKAVEGQEGPAESQDAGGNAQGQQSQAPESESDSGHAEYATFPVKAQGNTKYYKFKKLQGQGHVKGKLGRTQDGDDPYAQIGLVDPGNNDKMPSHHKISNLKADLEKQGTKISKFINNNGGNSESNDQVSDNSQGEVQQAANQNQESPNQGSSSQQSISNQRSDQESAGNQESAQQSNGNQGNQDQQSASNQAADQSSDQDSAANQQSDQGTQQQQPQVTTQDGVTTETQINADSPKMVAQLLKISQRLHEINNKKEAAQNEKQTNNGNSKPVTNNFTGAEVPQKSRDDAYATIGSFDPNVKKKAAIGKKKLLMSKLGLSNDNNIVSRRS